MLFRRATISGPSSYCTEPMRPCFQARIRILRTDGIFIAKILSEIGRPFPRSAATGLSRRAEQSATERLACRDCARKSGGVICLQHLAIATRPHSCFRGVTSGCHLIVVFQPVAHRSTGSRLAGARPIARREPHRLRFPEDGPCDDVRENVVLCFRRCRVRQSQWRRIRAPRHAADPGPILFAGLQ